MFTQLQTKSGVLLLLLITFASCQKPTQDLNPVEETAGVSRRSQASPEIELFFTSRWCSILLCCISSMIFVIRLHRYSSSNKLVNCVINLHSCQYPKPPTSFFLRGTGYCGISCFGRVGFWVGPASGRWLEFHSLQFLFALHFISRSL